MNTPMTPGQMKQLAEKLIKSVPTDLSFNEATSLIEGPNSRFNFDQVWKSLRNPDLCPIKVPTDTMRAICELQFVADNNGNPDALEKFIEETDVSTEMEDVKVAFFDFGAKRYSGAEIRRRLKQSGFRPATPRDLVGFMTRFPEYAERYGHLCIVPNHRTHLMVCWYDEDDGDTKFELIEYSKDYQSYTHVEVLAVKL